MTNSDMSTNIPKGIEPPTVLGGDVCQFEAWNGKTLFRRGEKESRGDARVFLNLLPVPEFRFEFTPETKPTLKDSFLNCPLGLCTIDCGPPIGSVTGHVTNSSATYTGHIEAQSGLGDDGAKYDSATFLILNGPQIDGDPITRGRASFCGRMSARVDNLEVIVDRITSEKQPRTSIYESTHVALFNFENAVSVSQIDRFAKNLFRSFSLMKCRWVGQVGPWLGNKEASDSQLRVSVTKTMRNGGAISWCHSSMGSSFSHLFPVMTAAFSDDARAEPLQTALHWLIESEQCAGGVEGAIILQQAAFECLAWLEIVVVRKICSNSGFKALPASDKIRWLLSLYNIEVSIPEKSTEITSYAKAYNLRDLVDVLVDVRNALVHAEPKKAARLFSRNRGDEERGDLWYQVGGVLQQAFLASIGFQGAMLRRDLDTELAVNAVKSVPWAN